MNNKKGAMDELATQMVGDNKNPNTFFVSVKNSVTLITTDFNIACDYFRRMVKHRYTQENWEVTLEDRKWGVICSREQNEQGKWVTYDDELTFRKEHKIKL